MWRAVLVLVCFGPLDGSWRHRNNVDLLTVLQFRFVQGDNFFFSWNGAHETCERDILSGWNSAFITVLLPKPWCRGGIGGKKDLAWLQQRPGPSGTLPSGTREMDVNFSRQVQKTTSFFCFFSSLFFFKRVHTFLYYLSLPLCFTLLDCSW